MFFEKVKKNAGFNCYAFMVDYENMGLDWPDGYEASQIDGQAPIAVNDNYLFFAKNDTIHMLDFGSFKEQHSPLPSGAGATFNKALEAVAMQNEEKENTYKPLENIIGSIEIITRAKHGDNDLEDMILIMIAGKLEGLISKLSQSGSSYTLEIVPDESTPSRDGLCGMQMHINTNGQEVTLEHVLDDIDGEAFRPVLEKMYWLILTCILMPQLEQAVKQSDAYFKEHDIKLEEFMGDLISYALNGSNKPHTAAGLSEDMRNIWGFNY